MFVFHLIYTLISHYFLIFIFNYLRPPSTPLYNTVMTGVRVCCTLLSAKDRAIIHFMVQAMNGKVSTSLDKNVTISINIFKSTFLSVTFSAFFFF